MNAVLTRTARKLANSPSAVLPVNYHIPSQPELFSMIVVMEQGATPEQIKHMIERVEAFGLKAHPIQGTERTVIAAIGEKRSEMKEALASGPGVESVMPILAPYKVASREVKKEP